MDADEAGVGPGDSGSGAGQGPETCPPRTPLERIGWVRRGLDPVPRPRVQFLALVPIAGHSCSPLGGLMANEWVTRISTRPHGEWDENGMKPTQLFRCLVAKLSEGPLAGEGWSRPPGAGAPRKDLAGEGVAADPNELMDDACGGRLQAAVSLPLEGLHGDGRRTFHLPLSIDVRGRDSEPDPVDPLEGDVVLALPDTAPFCATTDPDGRPNEHPFNELVRSNLERIQEILFEAIEALRPDSLRVFSEPAVPLAWNAHWAWWKGAEACSDDIGQSLDVWRSGKESWGLLPALEDPDAAEAACRHTWRSEEGILELSDSLNRWAAEENPVTVDRVRSLLDADRFDQYEVEGGFAILEHPYFMNATLDRFCLELGLRT